MNSYRQSLYHIVFCTKDHKPCLTAQNREQLFRYIWGIIKNKNCKLYRINGVEDHIHILSDLHSSVNLADYIKDIKVGSSVWIKKKEIFNDFKGWAEGYGAFTYATRDRDKVIEYIKNQVEHHKKTSFLEEYKVLLKEFGIAFDNKNI